MFLNAADMLSGNKDKIFKRLMGRTTLLKPYTTLHLGPRDKDVAPLQVKLDENQSTGPNCSSQSSRPSSLSPPPVVMWSPPPIPVSEPPLIPRSQSESKPSRYPSRSSPASSPRIRMPRSPRISEPLLFPRSQSESKPTKCPSGSSPGSSPRMPRPPMISRSQSNIDPRKVEKSKVNPPLLSEKSKKKKFLNFNRSHTSNSSPTRCLTKESNQSLPAVPLRSEHETENHAQEMYSELYTEKGEDQEGYMLMQMNYENPEKNLYDNPGEMVYDDPDKYIYRTNISVTRNAGYLTERDAALTKGRTDDSTSFYDSDVIDGGVKDEIKVKTISLCWWSEILNDLVISSDHRIELDAVFCGRKEDIIACTVLLAGGTVSKPTFSSVEAGIIFGLIYQIPELVRINVKWIKNQIDPSCFVDILKIYQSVSKYAPNGILSAIRKYVEAVWTTSQLISSMNDSPDAAVDWLGIIGIDNIPVRLLQEPLDCGTISDPNSYCRKITAAVAPEMTKTDQELDASASFLKCISPEFKKFFSVMVNNITDVNVMREYYQVIQQRDSKIMMTVMSSGFCSMLKNIRSAMEYDVDDEKETELFVERKWRNCSARELFLAFNLHEVYSDNGIHLPEFVVVEIILDWIRFKKFQVSADVCTNLFRYVQDLRMLSLPFINAAVAEVHALLGPGASSLISSRFAILPEELEFAHDCQDFILTKEQLNLLLHAEQVTLKSLCTLTTCCNVGSTSAVTVILDEAAIKPHLQIVYPVANTSLTEHIHYDYIHWCFTDGQLKSESDYRYSAAYQLADEKIHLVSVMTRQFGEIKRDLSSIDGCALLFFAKKAKTVFQYEEVVSF